MRQILNLLLLFSAFLSWIFGILLFKSSYNDFSLVDSSFMFIIIPLLGSALFMALGTYISFHTFRGMKRH